MSGAWRLIDFALCLRNDTRLLSLMSRMRVGTGCDGMAQEHGALPKVGFGVWRSPPVSAECSSAVAGFQVSVDGGALDIRRPN